MPYADDLVIVGRTIQAMKKVYGFGDIGKKDGTCSKRKKDKVYGSRQETNNSGAFHSWKL
jgi:hypothetical protein